MPKSLQVNYVHPDSLKPWDKNPRKGLEEASKKLAKTIGTIGFVNPIIAKPDGTICAGHTRLLAAKKLGLTEVPVIFVDFGSDESAELYAIGDNRSGEWTKWDRKILGEVLSGLKEVDLEELSKITTFSKGDIQNLVAVHESHVTKKEQRSLVEDAVLKERGISVESYEIYELGRHRLMCGDSGDPEHVRMLMDGHLADLVNTDPPYGVEVMPRSNAAVSESVAAQIAAGELTPQAKDRFIQNDGKENAHENLSKWIKNIATCMRPGASIYLWLGYTNFEVVPPLFRENNLKFSQTIVWIKNQTSPPYSFKGFRKGHEWCFHGWKEGETRYFDEMLSANCSDVWAVDVTPRQHTVHVTEKPVELARLAMEYSSKYGDLVVDLFGGSGSTLIAGEMMGRTVYMMEKDPAYCEVVINRWMDYQEGKGD